MNNMNPVPDLGEKLSLEQGTSGVGGGERKALYHLGVQMELQSSPARHAQPFRLLKEDVGVLVYLRAALSLNEDLLYLAELICTSFLSSILF